MHTGGPEAQGSLPINSGCNANAHREVGVATDEVVDQVRELGLGDDLLGVQVEALEEVLVRLPAAQLVLHLLEEVQLLRQVGPRKALLLCSRFAGGPSAIGMTTGLNACQLIDTLWHGHAQPLQDACGQPTLRLVDKEHP